MALRFPAFVCLSFCASAWFCSVAAAQQTEPELAQWIEQYSADLQTLEHRYRVPLDEAAIEKRKQVNQNWLEKLRTRNFDELDQVGKIDFLLLRSELEYRIENARLETARDRQATKWLPYAHVLIDYCKAREDVNPIEASCVATLINDIAKEVEDTELALEEVSKDDRSEQATAARLEALRACELLQSLGRAVKEAHEFYNGYDPQYSWWVKTPMERLVKALDSHRNALRNKVVGVPESDEETIIGLPIGAEGLELELQHEWIALGPAELVEIANREMAWCEREMAAATAELGFSEDWRAAMEHVKSKHVQPGQQPQMIHKLAWEAIRFLEAHDLVTVPPMAADGWRMTMMSPERQRVNPYFLGGDNIIVSFPMDTMTHDEKLMSMRSNNEHFSRATVHHELIPGHHLQHYMLPRYRPYRALFDTPFWIEGWALYWEMLLWDLDFAQGPEDRVGMLFWRKHRCARIIFSLSYHLGTMTPEECIDYLVERVGHERSAATAEVRRSIMGGYSPLYQAAYMLGGLQLRSLHQELVQGGEMSNRQFHDAVLHEHSIPIEVLRNYLTQQPLLPETRPSWRFAQE